MPGRDLVDGAVRRRQQSACSAAGERRSTPQRAWLGPCSTVPCSRRSRLLCCWRRCLPQNPKWTRKNTHRFILHTEAQVTSELLQVRITSGSSEIGTMAMPVSRFADGRWVNDVFPVQHGGEQKGSLRIIGILCRPLVEAPLPPAEGAMYNVPKAPFVRPPAKLEDKEGFLVKRGQMFKNWKRRWFRLRGTLLYYSENKTSDPKGSVDLKGATIGPSKTVKADVSAALRCRVFPALLAFR